MGRLPTFIVIGAMKSGTNSLHNYLHAHPQISMAACKETDFFIREKNYGRGLEWYRTHFVGEARAYGETSPNYTKYHLFPGVPERMHAVLPDVKLIYLVRDPLDRIVSEYLHDYALGVEKRPVSEAVADVDDNIYVRNSMYYAQLEKYLALYPPENVLLVESEKLKHCRREALREIFQFLDVDDDYYSSSYEAVYHKSSRKLRPWVKRYLLTSTLARRVRPYVPKALKEAYWWLEEQTIRRPELKGDARRRVVEVLRPDVERLRAFCGRSFEAWSI